MCLAFVASSQFVMDIIMYYHFELRFLRVDLKIRAPLHFKKSLVCCLVVVVVVLLDTVTQELILFGEVKDTPMG